jgi:hypothetical protein
MKKLFSSPKSIVLVIAIFLVTAVGYSQGPPDFPAGTDDTNDQAPISSLVVLGLVAGAVFGVKKLK